MKVLLTDTGPLVAAIDADDAHHERCVAFLDAQADPLLTTWPVVTEAAWLLRGSPGGVIALLRMIEDGQLLLAPLDPSAAPRLSEIVRTYAKSRVQLADASVIVVAERLKLDTIFTLDRRDFSFLKTADGAVLKIVPE